MNGGSPWRLSWRADPVVRVLADRHYNRQKIGAAQFVPPGRCLVLKTADGKAGWISSWPIADYVQHAWAGAWMNSFFRNEGDHLASDLIRWAVAHTRSKWPDVPPLGMVSFVDPDKTEGKEVPGWCYRRAGWSHVGYTQAGLWAFQQLPGRRIKRRSKPMPDAVPVPGAQMSLFDDRESALWVLVWSEQYPAGASTFRSPGMNSCRTSSSRAGTGFTALTRSARTSGGSRSGVSSCYRGGETTVIDTRYRW